MEIKIKDVKEFLQTNGYDWNNVFLLKNGRIICFRKKLENVEDKINLEYLPLQIKHGKMENGNIEKGIEVRLTDFVVTARGEDKSFVIEKSLSKNWVNFLLRKYKQEYADEVEKTVSAVEHNLIHNLNNSLVHLMIEQRKLEDKAEKTFLRTKKKDITAEEYASAMCEYKDRVVLMLSHSTKIADEKAEENRRLKKSLTGIAEIREQISEFKY